MPCEGTANHSYNVNTFIDCSSVTIFSAAVLFNKINLVHSSFDAIPWLRVANTINIRVCAK